MVERRFVYTPAMVALTALVLLVPLAGLLLLLRQPQLDLHWEHHPAHFWLVLLTALLSAALAYTTGAAALRRGDARVLFVSLAFLSAAGFLGLHEGNCATTWGSCVARDWWSVSAVRSPTGCRRRATGSRCCT